MYRDVASVLLYLYLVQGSLPTRRATVQSVNTKLALGIIKVVPNIWHEISGRHSIGTGADLVEAYSKNRFVPIASSTPYVSPASSMESLYWYNCPISPILAADFGCPCY